MGEIRLSTGLKAWEDLPKSARDDCIELLTGITDPAMKAKLIRILAVCRRDRRKAETDAEGDRNRRTLAGAHLPRWRVEQYKELARETNMSLHAWVTTALEAQAHRQTRKREPVEPLLCPDGSLFCDRSECRDCPHSDRGGCRLYALAFVPGATL